MSDYDRYANTRYGAGLARSGVAVDQGLRAYMIGVYNYMTLGLGVTGLVACLVVASLLNLFLHSSGLQFGISVVAVVIFAGLTAWDTQKIKEMYSANDDGTVAGRKSVMGALTLYLDFINLFLFLLRFMGDRR